MAGFLRDILATVSREPPPPAAGDEETPIALDRLDQRLASLGSPGGGPRQMLRIQPAQCSVWDGNPRDVPALTHENCRTLIESIATEGGNRIPVLVRRNGADAELPYELLVGSRRRFAIDWLNHNGRPELMLQALIVDLTDEEAFRLADIENREREDISELARARSYRSAVNRFYGGVQSRMAAALGLSNSQLSRLIALALMPDEIVAAFPGRDDIRVRHSEILTPLLRRADERQRLLEAAGALSAEQLARREKGEKPIAPAAVLARLRSAALPEGPADRKAGAIMVDGLAVGRLRTLKSGDLSVELSFAADSDLEAIFTQVRRTVDQAQAAGQ